MLPKKYLKSTILFTFMFIFIFLGVFYISGCGDSDGNPYIFTKNISSPNGIIPNEIQVLVDGGDFSGTLVVIPEGTQITSSSDELLDSFTLTISSFISNFGLGIGKVLNFGPDGIKFSKPVTITIPYNENNWSVEEVGGLRIANIFPEGNSAIVECLSNIVLDTGNKTVKGETMHFSLLGIIYPYLYTYILMGEVPIQADSNITEAFNYIVEKVEAAVLDFEFLPPGDDMSAINPWHVVGHLDMPFPEGSIGKVIEICAPIFADDAMAMGKHHAVGMPCEIGIWTEDSDNDGTDDMIRINTLNESSIFSFFFADVIGAEGFKEFETLIKSQVKDIVKTVIDNVNGYWFYEPQTPEFTIDELEAVQSWATDGGYYGEKGFAVRYEVPISNKDPLQSDANFVDQIVDSIASAIGNTQGAREDWHITTSFNIPVGNYLDTNNPFSPVRQIELCSPYYASNIVGLGPKYMVALPCIVSTYLNDITMDAHGMPNYQVPDTVIIDVLNPEFLLKNYFKDQPTNIQEQIEGMASIVKGEVISMVESGLSGYTI